MTMDSLTKFLAKAIACDYIVAIILYCCIGAQINHLLLIFFLMFEILKDIKQKQFYFTVQMNVLLVQVIFLFD